MSLSKKKLFVTLFLCICLMLFIMLKEDRGTYLVFQNVGQGDSILIYRDGSVLLIDGGPSNEKKVFLPQKLCPIKAALLTHPHNDHLFGLNRALKLCSVDVVYTNLVEYSSKVNLEFNYLIQKATHTALYEGDTFSFNDITFYVLWPPKNGEVFGNVNDSSIVLLLDYGSFEALLTGDISAKVQDRLNLSSLAHVIQGGVDLYKVPHHGSKYSFSEEFLLLLQPKVAVVSVGENSYGHPSSLFINYFSKHNIPLYRTDTNGDIRINMMKTP